MRGKDRPSGASSEHTRLKPQLLSATGENVRLGCKIRGLPRRGGSVSARGEETRCGGLQVREGRKTTILLKAKNMPNGTNTKNGTEFGKPDCRRQRSEQKRTKWRVENTWAESRLSGTYTQLHKSH